jgi:hypothetical protein
MKKIAAVAMAAVMAMSLAAKADEPATKPSQTERAFRKVKIDGSDVYFDVIHQFMDEAPGMNFKMSGYVNPEFRPQIEIERGAAGDTPTLSISVFIPRGSEANAKERAEEILSEWQSRLAVLTQRQRDSWKTKAAELQKQNQNLAQRKEELEKRLQMQEDDIQDISAAMKLADVTPQSLRELAQTLEAEYEAAGIDVEGKTARQMALTDAIAKLSKQVESKLADDPIGQQLQQVVDTRQQAVDQEQSQYKAGIGTLTDLNRDVAALAEAKATVLERKEAVSQIAGMDTIHKWNDDLLSLSVDLAELQARKEALEKRIDMFKQGMHQIAMAERPSIESLQKSLDDLNDLISTVHPNSAMAEAALGAEQPTITVIESRDVPLGQN